MGPVTLCSWLTLSQAQLNLVPRVLLKIRANLKERPGSTNSERFPYPVPGRIWIHQYFSSHAIVGLIMNSIIARIFKTLAAWLNIPLALAVIIRAPHLHWKLSCNSVERMPRTKSWYAIVNLDKFVVSFATLFNTLFVLSLLCHGLRIEMGLNKNWSDFRTDMVW